MNFSNFPKGNWSTAPDEHSPRMANQSKKRRNSTNYEKDLLSLLHYGNNQINKGIFV